MDGQHIRENLAQAICFLLEAIKAGFHKEALALMQKAACKDFFEPLAAAVDIAGNKPALVALEIFSTARDVALALKPDMVSP
jgi:hypothetical protein